MIIAVIPAKSSSRRLPGKNMKPMLGVPMLSHTIQFAKACPLIDQVIVSTDSSDIATFSRSMGIAVVMRPEALCGEAIIADVVRHCLSQLPYKDQVTRIVALQPDHPDRELDLTAFLSRTIELDIADAITLDPTGLRNGSIRIFRVKDLLENRISYSILTVTDPSTNIHTDQDFKVASQHLAQLKK